LHPSSNCSPWPNRPRPPFASRPFRPLLSAYTPLASAYSLAVSLRGQMLSHFPLFPSPVSHPSSSFVAAVRRQKAGLTLPPPLALPLLNNTQTYTAPAPNMPSFPLIIAPTMFGSSNPFRAFFSPASPGSPASPPLALYASVSPSQPSSPIANLSAPERELLSLQIKSELD
jgi:hypothetical protein